jgi:hypothetical protein
MFPKKNANTFSVGQILNNADVLYKEIREEGAIIKGDNESTYLIILKSQCILGLLCSLKS